MKKTQAQKVVDRYLASQQEVLESTSMASRVASRKMAELYPNSPMTRVAGEIRFVKDNGPEQREIPNDFNFKPKHVKPMARVLLSLSCSLGHLISGQGRFTKLKSVNVSPDGKLGGKGYIQPIKDIRTNLAKAIEIISDTVDTLHDELKADHWCAPTKQLSKKDRAEVDELVQDSEDIMDDPEAYDEKEYQEEVLDDLAKK
jgi:hypothetical protein